MENELPRGWESKKLGDVITLNYGKGLPKRDRKEGKVPVYGSNGIVGHNDTSVIDEDTIIVGRKGSVGKIHFVKGSSFPIDTTYYVSLNNKSVTLKFVFYLLKHLNLEEVEQSTAIPGINRNNVYNLHAVIPPLEVQNAIVAKLDKIFESYKILRDEKEKVQKENTKFIQSAIEKALNLSELKEQYGEKELGDKEISSWITQGPNPKYDGIEDEGYKVLKTKDLYDDVIYYEKADNITKKILEEFKKFELKEGDFLISLVGVGSIGKVNVFREQKENRYIFTRATGIIRLNTKKILPEFLYLFFRSLHGKKMIENGISGTTGQLVIKTSYIKSLKIPTPPLEIQSRIVENSKKIFDQLSLISNERKVLSRNVEILPQAILSKAFKGEL